MPVQENRKPLCVMTAARVLYVHTRPSVAFVEMMAELVRLAHFARASDGVFVPRLVLEQYERGERRPRAVIARAQEGGGP